MFSKSYAVDPKHIDFQGVMDGLYYPFYFEWARHAFLYEALGIDIEQLFEQGKMYVVLEYQLKFKHSVKRGDQVDITCDLEKHEKSTRINVIQQMTVNGQIAAEATFVCTCIERGRPNVPFELLNMLNFK
ncbi:acyl-CoA thioesterase [Pantoea sp. Al-1710]|uniref:Acyl-CoA thioesterase n=1 Tax=Candidatus Pantoea communis TaxID=2608354 RepID=A0ABX0RI23_9GAMM|nr:MULTISPECIES: acyl-CoA thioesterase [Pantoea]NIG13012.1 acyl-CoA thioesterase [Pantoea sp. Cy-640]NIG17287.1 acyl-CoA thioesterase [Pantoea communis]